MTQGPPAWHPDPSGRHQHRWWDGLGYTDQVADHGVVTTDANATPLVASVPDRPWKMVALVVGGFVALGLLGAAFALVLGGDDGTSGTGTFEGTINSDEEAGVHAVGGRGVIALTIELEPDEGLDAVVGLVVSRDDAQRIEDLYDDLVGPDASGVEEAFGIGAIDGVDDDAQVVFRTDVGFAGDDEQVLLVVPFDVDVQVVVAPFDITTDGEGDYELTIDAFTLDAEADDGIEDLLDAVADDDDIPRDFRQLAEDQLAFS